MKLFFDSGYWEINKKVIILFFRSVIENRLVHYSFLSVKFGVKRHGCFIQNEFKVLLAYICSFLYVHY